jgi:hypothetical protein
MHRALLHGRELVLNDLFIQLLILQAIDPGGIQEKHRGAEHSAALRFLQISFYQRAIFFRIKVFLEAVRRLINGHRIESGWLLRATGKRTGDQFAVATLEFVSKSPVKHKK